MRAYKSRIPATNRTNAVNAPTVPGTANWRCRFGTEARRHAMSGPMPVSASNASPSGMLTWLKNGGPTVIFVPETSSDRIGNSVPHSTEKAIPMKSRLLKRKLASRLTIDSSRASAVSSGSRVTYNARLAAPDTIRNARKKRSEEHTSELQSRLHLVCRLLLEKKKTKTNTRRQPAV